ncbi:RagB/SusD family nutrient uptake outer membrane protein [Abyssalbus ytuae]|uniref:RagB/SusD family nutrient uptake outer membrane protein n=1 Tax=Abyssalbus ytuae TaxID=2926907 RepID=A0A9E7D267_9FLAO|nr:RagB/SusD family nutrient uptake outer membrane protein [Abyssalbus ytuae]UOB16374.1 RagB/SusD family nutrient uptake outer membrane protein [Abyssalbus ytuae]
MKNRIKIITFLFLSLGFFACDDEINDLQPFIEGNPETFFNSVQTFQYGVDGAYRQFWNYYSSPSAGLQGIPDIMSDNAILVQTGRKSNEDYFDYRYVASTGASSPDVSAVTLYWSEAYEAVNVANLVIGQIDNLADSPEKNNILGQALAIRAYAHFDLARVYAKIPTQSSDANSSPGIVYLKVEDGDTGNPFAQPSRETVAENYTEIIEDLELASQLIADENGEGRLDRNAVFGILSRIYLYNGDYQKAIDAANEVTTPIATPDQLAGVYTDSNEAGIVFKLGVNTSSESNFNNVGVLYSQSNSSATISEYAIDFEFFNSINSNDIRRDIIQFVGTNQGNDYNAIKKFLGEEGQVNGRVDIKVIRAAEVILNKAEAQFELDMETEALATLDMLRDQRFTSYTGGETGQNLEDAIQFNRRVELAFEGHRFFDLKRRGEPISRSNNGDIIDGSGTPAEVLTLSADDHRFQFPIPSAERTANPNLDQNGGY